MATVRVSFKTDTPTLQAKTRTPVGLRFRLHTPVAY